MTVARYVGRVAIGTSPDDTKSFLEQNAVDVISLEAVEQKHNRFASFKLVVKKSQLQLVENSELWPEGVVIGRWWSPKTSARTSQLSSSTSLSGNGSNNDGD